MEGPVGLDGMVFGFLVMWFVTWLVTKYGEKK